MYLPSKHTFIIERLLFFCLIKYCKMPPSKILHILEKVEKWKMYMEIHQLLQQGFSKVKVAEKLGISRTTVYRYLNRDPDMMSKWVKKTKVRKKKLDPKQSTVNLPPIPSNSGTFSNQIASNYEMSEKDILIDAHFTASAMAKENFNSSENMKNKQVKKLHSAMALQQATIAEMYEDLMSQMGWINQPNASVTEQTSIIMHLNTIPHSEITNNQQPRH